MGYIENIYDKATVIWYVWVDEDIKYFYTELEALEYEYYMRKYGYTNVGMAYYINYE